MYCLEVMGNASMDADKFFIKDAGERDLIEHLHGQVVDLLIVFIEACMDISVHYCLKLKKEVSCRHSWFPLSIITCLGRLIFIAIIKSKT